MRSNGRSILASTLPPNDLNLHPGERLTMVCPDCRSWRVIRRGMIWPHRADDGMTRCPGSGTRLVVDLTSVEWQSAMVVAVRQAATRHGSRTHRKPAPPTPQPLHRIAAA
ncbi:hypothetical protein [Nonomuraea sp. NPDC050540]|uniref:hypothetical protein n=1 Tax=Nonomuraea sp. NPDC050540 TaxID=3364367 RepID=UPI0037B825CB